MSFFSIDEMLAPYADGVSFVNFPYFLPQNEDGTYQATPLAALYLSEIDDGLTRYPFLDLGNGSLGVHKNFQGDLFEYMKRSRPGVDLSWLAGYHTGMTRHHGYYTLSTGKPATFGCKKFEEGFADGFDVRLELIAEGIATTHNGGRS